VNMIGRAHSATSRKPTHGASARRCGIAGGFHFLLLVLVWMLSAATASADALFVTNLNANNILRFDLAGNLTLFADASDGLLMPDSLALDASGNLFVANRGASNILRFDSTRNAAVFADAGDGILTPFALAFDSAGNLFVANSGGGLTGSNNILRFDAAGNGGVFADASDGITDPRGVAFDSNGNLYVVNQTLVRNGMLVAGNILRFDAAGNLIQALESSQFFFLDELTIDANNKLFVSNLGAATILRVDPAGPVGVFATSVVATGSPSIRAAISSSPEDFSEAIWFCVSIPQVTGQYLRMPATGFPFPMVLPSPSPRLSFPNQTPCSCGWGRSTRNGHPAASLLEPMLAGMT
jgi:hypothetical protein